MALTALRKEQLAKMNIPDDAEMVRRVTSFQRRSGMTVNDLAEELKFSPSIIYMFLRGTYYAEATVNSLNLRARLKEYMDLYDVDLYDELRGTHHDTADYARIREACMTALERGVMYTVDGAPGMQKSWSLLSAAKEINQGSKGRAVYIYARAGQTAHSFLREVATTAGLPERGNVDQLIRKLRFFLAKERVVLLVDECNHLATETMEILRQLLDRPPFFGVVMAGTNEFTLRFNSWKNEQLHSRNRDTITLTGHSKDEARDILQHRLGMGRAEADTLIADCMATAARTGEKDGKLFTKKYTYISSRKLFAVVEELAASTTQLEAIA